MCVCGGGGGGLCACFFCSSSKISVQKQPVALNAVDFVAVFRFSYSAPAVIVNRTSAELIPVLKDIDLHFGHCYKAVIWTAVC